MSIDMQNLALDNHIGYLDMEHHGGSPISTYYKMIGIASGNLVSWIVMDTPDSTGASYTGPGILDLASIFISGSWT